MTHPAGVAFLIAAAFCTAPPALADADAQQAASVRPEMVDRFYRGRAIVNAAAQAAGGAQALRGIAGLSYVVDGDVANDVQGYRASGIGDPARDGSQRVVSRFDFAGSRFYQQIQQKFDSGYDSAFASIWRGGVQFAPRYVPRDYTKTDNAPSPFAAGGAIMISSRWLPPIILQRALQNFRSIVWIGEGAVNGAPADIVEFSFDEVTRFRIYVDRADHMIRRVDTIAPDPVTGDDVSIAEISGAQTISGVMFPTNIVARRRGAALLNLQLTDVAVNPAFDDADFLPPEGFALAPSQSQPARATQIAGGTYEVSGLAGGTYQAPFVVMDDFVVAFESPLGLVQSRQVIAEIRRVAGDKPIRYVVVSHFHSDHAGGVGAYVEAGATVLSSAENRQALETYAAFNRPQFQGLEGPVENIEMRFEAVPEEGMEIVDRAGGRLRVVGFSGTTHVERMLALHDLQSGVFMGADHYIEAVRWNPTFERTAKWIKENPEVETLLGVHNRPMSRADFLAVAKSRRAEGRRGAALKLE